LRIIVLGGLGEVGMNCLALEQSGEVLVIDCGVTFDHRGLGIDVIHPDFEALHQYRVAGLFVTHGHEDHIGAIPYFLRRFDVPVFGPRYALNLLRERSTEHEILEHADLRCVAPRTSQRVGSFEVEPIRVTHSIADATALAIRTDAGLVIHTGDFKFDEAPPDGESFDVERLQELSREGVDLLLSDSTNVDSNGSAGSEEGVGRTLDEIVANAPQAVVVAMFASNVHRLRMLGEIARRHGRKIVTLGRGMSTHARVARMTARSTGKDAGRPYLEWPADLACAEDRARDLPKRAVLAVVTGSQGERAAALARLARGDHPALDLSEEDVVIMSSRVIPGNELEVVRVMNDLLRRGVTLRTWWSNPGVHVSGHANRTEQRRMIEIVKPGAFVPVHGTLHHLTRHAELATEVGVGHVRVLENGDVGTLDTDGLRKSSRVQAGRVNIFGGRVLPPQVVAERAALAAVGAVHVAVPIDPHGRLAGEIEVATRGVIDESTYADVMVSARRNARAALDALLATAGPRPEDSRITETARLAVRQTLARALGFKPVTVATLVRFAP
jgi:ribonuclease J